MNMKNKKDIDIYYCFRYRCKRCPKQRECEEEQKDLVDRFKVVDRQKDRRDRYVYSKTQTKRF